MCWWPTHSLKVGALNVTYGGVTQITQVVVVVTLLTWKLWQLIIYGASGEVTLTLNMVAQVTHVIICRRGRRETPMLNHLVVVAVDEGRRWHIIALLHDRRENLMLDHLVTVDVEEGRSRRTRRRLAKMPYVQRRRCLDDTWQRCRSGRSSRSSVLVVLVSRCSLVLMMSGRSLM